MSLQWQDHQITAHKSVSHGFGSLFDTHAKERSATLQVSRSDYRGLKLLSHSFFLESISMTYLAHQTSQESLPLRQDHRHPMSCVLQQ